MTPEERIKKIVSGIEEAATVDEVRRVVARAIAEELNWSLATAIFGYWGQIRERAAAFAAIAGEPPEPEDLAA